MNLKALTLGAIAAASTVAAGAPVMAQDWADGGGYGWRSQPVSYLGGDLRDREDRIQVWIDRARDEGRLPGWRAFHAQGELDAVRRDQRNLWNRQGGLGPDQRAWLSGRLDHLASYIRESGDEGRGYGGWRRW